MELGRRRAGVGGELPEAVGLADRRTLGPGSGAARSDFAYEDCDVDIEKPMSEWAARGVRTATGEPLPATDAMAAIFLPAGYKGPAFLVRKNFHVILTYNASTSYALAVSLLSDRFRGAGDIVASWPRDELPLDKDQRMALQSGLNALGYDVGEPDGVLGRKTRAGLRAYQKAHSFRPTGLRRWRCWTHVKKDRARGGT